MPDYQIAATQGRTLSGGMPTLCSTQLGGLALVLWYVGDAVPALLLLQVGLAQAAAILLRLVPRARYRRASEPPQALRRFFHRSIAASAIEGAGWAVMLYVFAPYLREQDHYFFFALCVASSAMSMATTSIYLPVYFSRLVPMLGGYLYLEHQRDSVSLDLFLGCAGFFGLIMYTAVRLNRLQLETIGNAFENERLIAVLTEQTRLAGEAARSKSRMLAAASHDLRQPMHALSLYLGAMDGAGSAPQWSTGLANATVCAHAMDQMFSTLLDVAHLEAAPRAGLQMSFPVAQLLERIRTEFLPQAAERGLELRVRTCRGWLFTDAGMVERILRNLVSNALRYTERGKVLVGCRRRAGRLELGVYDTGVGIGDHQRERIFDEFYQAGAVAGERGLGLGLGLALVRRMADMLGTDVRLHSIPGRGSRFTFALARLPVPSEARRAALLERPSPRLLAGACVVVIDDDGTVLDASRALLESWGSDVITAYSSEHALTQLRAARRYPAAILCDYRLAAENGVEAIETLQRAYRRHIPALLITGDTGLQRVAATVGCGIAVLHKPVHEQKLLQMLQHVIEREHKLDGDGHAASSPAM